MSKHLRRSFDQIAGEAIFCAVDQVKNIVNKTKSFLKQRMVEDLKLYRQFCQYQGIPVTSFWENRFSSVQSSTSPEFGKTITEDPNINKGKFTGKDIIDKVTSQQALVFNKIRDIAIKQGYELKALPSPSGDLIIDLYSYDLHEMLKNNKEKIFVKRRNETTRMYISKDGELNLLDPNLSIENFIRVLAPDFKVDSVGLKSYEPHLQKTRNLKIGIRQNELEKLSLSELKKIHKKVLSNQNSSSITTDGVTLLDLKIEIAKGELKHCQLCGNNCRVNRFLHKGKCGLGIETHYTSAYVHLAEECIINPSLAINLDSFGCGLDCCFCQSKGIAETSNQELKPLDERSWLTIKPDMTKADTIEFAGGSPDENIYGILEFLKKTPKQILPVVSNCHLYANEIVYRLWDGVIDIYVADFKFGNDTCAKELANINNYVNKSQVIIRLLVLPSHIECCALQILKMLTPFKEKILLNIMDQYVPEYKILKGFHPELNKRVWKNEISDVLSKARNLRFRLI